MKKLSLITTLLFSLSANAHDVWVTAPDNLAENQQLKAELSYGDNFPHAEEISASRIHIFKPLTLAMPNGQQVELVQQGKNYQYESQKPLVKGTYQVLATYQPTFWSEQPNGKWLQKNLQDVPDATYCEQTQMFGKRIVIVAGQYDQTVAQQSIGQELEIIPLANPTQVKAGEAFPIQVLYKGKPLSKATVTATSDILISKDLEATFDHREPQGFQGKTDKMGKMNFIALADGLWKIKVIHKTNYPDNQVCQKSALYSTLVIPVGTERAKSGTTLSHQ